jgi:hypothetical protein
MRQLLLIALLVLPVAVVSSAVHDVSPEDIAAGDECVSAEDPTGSGSCALNALQVKGMAMSGGEPQPTEPTPKDPKTEVDELEDTVPHLESGMDDAGPYEEVPSEEEAENPRLAEDLQNATTLKAAEGVSGSSFCKAHQVGYFCTGSTRIRCCKSKGAYVKCGSTHRATSCSLLGASYHYGGYHYHGGRWGGGRYHYHGVGWHPVGGHYHYHGGGYHGPYGGGHYHYHGHHGGYGGPWHMHPYGEQSTFCQSHNVGSFCHDSQKVHCCKDQGNFVECSAEKSTSERC